MVHELGLVLYYYFHSCYVGKVACVEFPGRTEMLCLIAMLNNSKRVTPQFSVFIWPVVLVSMVVVLFEF